MLPRESTLCVLYANLHMLAQLTCFSPPTHPHPARKLLPLHYPVGCAVALIWGAGGPVTRVMSGTYVPFSRSLGLGSREGAAGVVGCGMQVSQSTYSIYLQQEMQPCQMLAAFPKGSR